MPALTRYRREAFAQAFADGDNHLVAGKKAGYVEPYNCKGFEDLPEIKDRIAEIRRARLGGGSREVGVLIDELAETAIKARDLGTAPGVVAAKGLFDLVGKYKDKLPDPNAASAPQAAPAVLVDPLDADLSEEEWLARYGPDAPGGKPDMP